MSIDGQAFASEPAIPTANPLPPTPPVQVAAVGQGPTPQIAAKALADAVGQPVLTSLQNDLAANPAALFAGAGALLLVLLGVFVYLVVESVHNANQVAGHYLGEVFGNATTLWWIVAAVLVGGALIARSPVQDPPSIPGVSYPKGK